VSRNISRGGDGAGENAARQFTAIERVNEQGEGKEREEKYKKRKTQGKQAIGEDCDYPNDLLLIDCMEVGRLARDKSQQQKTKT
jgi:hypothetical protein